MRIVSVSALGAPVKGYLHEDHDRLIAHKQRPALIVCPGGAYRFTCPREADPPALSFFAMGFQVFVLDYAVKEKAGQFLPLRQLAETVSMVRHNAEKWHIRSDQIAVLGFSAGGHLAACLGALWHDKSLQLAGNCRPDALLLAYPVISLYEHTHAESCRYVTGGDEALREKLSVERHIGAQMPPTFVWHTVDDPSVPVENTLMLVNAMKAAGVPFECHLFAHGGHGLAMCNRETESVNEACAVWADLAKTWLNTLFDFRP